MHNYIEPESNNNSKPLTEFTYQAAKISHQNSKQTTCSLHQQDWELPTLKSMICSRSLLYSSCCCFLNLSNFQSVFSAFLFSWSTCSARTAELFLWAASRSRSLDQLVLIPAFFKEKVLQLACERTLETTSVTCSACIVSIASYENQGVNIRKRT